MEHLQWLKYFFNITVIGAGNFFKDCSFVRSVFQLHITAKNVTAASVGSASWRGRLNNLPSLSVLGFRSYFVLYDLSWILILFKLIILFNYRNSNFKCLVPVGPSFVSCNCMISIFPPFFYRL